mmetsp:Transcript_28249/g.27202  ORF Transcript_28249/g.27202 Transcript_28249/m.27202 type:complete len:185 (-) Transcript_28249:927-1481(-)
MAEFLDLAPPLHQGLAVLLPQLLPRVPLNLLPLPCQSFILDHIVGDVPLDLFLHLLGLELFLAFGEVLVGLPAGLLVPIPLDLPLVDLVPAALDLQVPHPHLLQELLWHFQSVCVLFLFLGEPLGDLDDVFEVVEVLQALLQVLPLELPGLLAVVLGEALPVEGLHLRRLQLLLLPQKLALPHP